MARKVSELVVKLTDQVTGPAAKMQAALKKAQSDMSKVSGYRDQKAALDRMAQAHQKARESVRQLGAALMAAEAPSRKMQAAYERAVQSADKLGNKLQWQQARVRSAADALGAMGVKVNNLAAGEMRLQAATQRATAALQRQEAAAARAATRRQALGTAAGAAGLAVGWRARQFGKDAITRAATFDTSLRHQRFATDICDDEQRRVLVPQAERIGQDTKFTNEDVVRAQTEFANGLPAALKRADVLKPIIDQAKNYALTLKGVDMSQGAMAVRGYLLSLGKDISTPEKADAEARTASNKMIRASKIGGMEHEDIMHLIQRGGSAARLVGLSDETILAMGVGMKRSNISGDQAGTALRTLSAKLANPTNKGMAAMATAGIDYADYTKLPGGMSVDNYAKKLKLDFGKSLTPAIRAKLEEAFADEDVFGDQGTFAKAVTEAVAPLFGKTKKGELAAADAKAIAKKAGEFHKFAIEAVNAEKLLLDILAKDPSLGVLNALMTDKHGNKFGLLAKGFEQFMKDRADLKSVAPDYGDKAAALLQGGLEGAINQLTGGIETLKQRLGTENESWLTPLTNKLASAVDLLTEGVKKSPTFAAGLGAIGAAGAGIGGAFKLMNDLVGGNAPAIALTGSAAMLGKSALALDAAAVALTLGKGAGSAVGAAATAATAGTTAAAGASKLAMFGKLGLAGLGAYGLYEAGSAIREGNQKLYAGVEPGEVHDEGRKRQRRAADLYRERMNEFRRLHEGTFDPVAPVGSGKTGFGLGGAVGTTPLDALIDKAGDAKDKLAELNGSVSPQINLAPVQELVRLSQQALDNLTRLGGAAGAARSAVSSIGSAPASRGRSDIAKATADLSRSRQTNMQDRPLV